MLEVINDTQCRIVDLLLERGSCNLSELTREIRLSKPAVFRHMKALVAAGLIREDVQSTDKGREARYSLRHFSIFYSINPDRRSMVRIQSASSFHPSRILLEQVGQAEFKEDLRKLVDAADEIAADTGITAIVLFGSVAEGKGTWKSDIDVAVIAAKWDKESKNMVGKIISDACLGTSRLIKPIYMSEERLVNEDSVLANEIRSSGMIVYTGQPGSDAVWRGMMRYKSTTR